MAPTTDWSLGLDDVDLNRLRVDYACSLIFEDTRVVIEGSFEVHTPDGVDHALDPGERTSFGPVLGVYPDRLTHAAAGADCSLHLDFISGAWIHGSQDDHYEAWEVTDPGSRLVVRPPAGGGGLTVWT